MSFLIDSAIISEVEEASKWGWISGVTTNPTLLAKSELPPEETLLKLSSLISGQIYYQLTSQSVELMIAESKKAKNLLRDKLVLKIPATDAGFKVVSTLSNDIPCSVTALFSPAQAMIAEAAGAQSVIVYYNRALRLMGDGVSFIKNVIGVLQESQTRVIAASIKSPEEVTDVRMLGIKDLTVPYSVLLEMPRTKLSESTIEDFNRTGTGLNIS